MLFICWYYLVLNLELLWQPLPLHLSFISPEDESEAYIISDRCLLGPFWPVCSEFIPGPEIYTQCPWWAHYLSNANGIENPSPSTNNWIFCDGDLYVSHHAHLLTVLRYCQKDMELQADPTRYFCFVSHVPIILLDGRNAQRHTNQKRSWNKLGHACTAGTPVLKGSWEPVMSPQM